MWCSESGVVLGSTRTRHRSCWRFSWTGSRGVVGGSMVSGLGTSGLYRCFLQVMWVCWLLQASDFSANLRPWLSGMRLCSTWRSLKTQDLVHERLQVEVWDGLGLCCCCEQEGEPKSNAFNLLIHLCSNPHLWSWDLGSDWKNEVVDESGWNQFPLEGGWAQPYRKGEELDNPGALSRAAAPPHRKESA